MALTNEMANFAEFIVEKKLEGSYLAKRILMIAAYVIVPLAIIITLMATGLGAIALIVLVPLTYVFFLPKIIVPATYRYVQIEYEWRIVAGDFAVDIIYGRKSRKEWIKPIQISSMIAIAPYRDEYKAAADASDIVNRYEAVTTMSNPDNYYCIYKDEEGKKSVVFFQATNKGLKIMKFHNRDTVVTEVVA